MENAPNQDEAIAVKPPEIDPVKPSTEPAPAESEAEKDRKFIEEVKTKVFYSEQTVLYQVALISAATNKTEALNHAGVILTTLGNIENELKKINGSNTDGVGQSMSEVVGAYADVQRLITQYEQTSADVTVSVADFERVLGFFMQKHPDYYSAMKEQVRKDFSVESADVPGEPFRFIPIQGEELTKEKETEILAEVSRHVGWDKVAYITEKYPDFVSEWRKRPVRAKFLEGQREGIQFDAEMSAFTEAFSAYIKIPRVIKECNTIAVQKLKEIDPNLFANPNMGNDIQAALEAFVDEGRADIVIDTAKAFEQMHQLEESIKKNEEKLTKEYPETVQQLNEQKNRIEKQVETYELAAKANALTPIKARAKSIFYSLRNAYEWVTGENQPVKLLSDPKDVLKAMGGNSREYDELLRLAGDQLEERPEFHEIQKRMETAFTDEERNLIQLDLQRYRDANIQDELLACYNKRATSRNEYVESLRADRKEVEQLDKNILRAKKEVEEKEKFDERITVNLLNPFELLSRAPWNFYRKEMRAKLDTLRGDLELADARVQTVESIQRTKNSAENITAALRGSVISNLGMENVFRNQARRSLESVLMGIGVQDYKDTINLLVGVDNLANSTSAMVNEYDARQVLNELPSVNGGFEKKIRGYFEKKSQLLSPQISVLRRELIDPLKKDPRPKIVEAVRVVVKRLYDQFAFKLKQVDQKEADKRRQYSNILTNLAVLKSDLESLMPKKT